MKNITKALLYILAGTVFGILMIKSEAASWYRIREMFLFQSFHMYGIIGTAVITGVIAVYISKKMHVKDFNGNPIIYQEKEKKIWKYLLGGTVFGIGWALTGACPGPMFVTLGYGFGIMSVVIFSALLGTVFYGIIKDILPH